MTEQEARQAASKLLTLAEELGLHIGGCGCCDSPWLAYEDENGQTDYISNDEWEALTL